MFVSLGRRARQPGDLVDLLRDCHSRIRAFSELAVTLSTHPDLSASDTTEACARIERYFVQSLPLHVRDEEDSIEPRLVGRSPAIDAAFARMGEQHHLHDELVGRLCEAVATVQRRPSSEEARRDLRAVAEPLQKLMEEHLRGEEDLIFPSIRRLLSTAEQEDIVWELQNRRKNAGWSAH